MAMSLPAAIAGVNHRQGWAAPRKKTRGFCGGGVPPAILMISTPRKTAGGTPAPPSQHSSYHFQGTNADDIASKN